MLAFNTRGSSTQKSKPTSALAVAGGTMTRGPSPIPCDPPGLFVSAPAAHKTRDRPPQQHKSQLRSVAPPPPSLAASPGSESTQSSATTAPTSVAYDAGAQGGGTKEQQGEPVESSNNNDNITKREKGPERRIRFLEQEQELTASPLPPLPPSAARAMPAGKPDTAQDAPGSSGSRASKPGTPQMSITGGFDFAADSGAPFADDDGATRPVEDAETWEALQEEDVAATEHRWRSRRLDSAPPRSRSTSRGDPARGTGLGLGPIPSKSSGRSMPFARFHTRQLSSLTEDSFLVDRSDRGSAMGAFEPAWADDMSNVDPGGSMRSSPSCADSGSASAFVTGTNGNASSESNHQKRASSQLSRLWTHGRGSSASSTNTEHRDEDSRERRGAATPDVEPSSGAADPGAYEVAALKRQVEQLQLLLTKRSAYSPDAGEDGWRHDSRPPRSRTAVPRPSVSGSGSSSAADHDDVAMLAAQVASLEEMFRRNATALPPLPHAPRCSTSDSLPTRFGSTNFIPLAGPASYVRSPSPSAFGDMPRSTTPSVIGPDGVPHSAEAAYYPPPTAASRRSFSLSHAEPYMPDRYSPYVTGLHGHPHRSHHHLPSQQERPWSPAPLQSPSAASQPMYPAGIYPYQDGTAAGSTLSFTQDGPRGSTSTSDSGGSKGKGAGAGASAGAAVFYRPLHRIESSSTISTQHNFTFNATPPVLPSDAARSGEPPPPSAGTAPNASNQSASSSALLTSPATALRKLALPANTDIFLDERHRPVVWHEGHFVPLHELLGAGAGPAPYRQRKTSFAFSPSSPHGPPHGDAGPGLDSPAGAAAAGFTPFGAYQHQRQLHLEQQQHMHYRQHVIDRQQQQQRHYAAEGGAPGLERSTSTNEPSTWSESSGGERDREHAPSPRSPTGSAPARTSTTKGHGTGGGGLHSKSLAGLLSMSMSKSKKQELRAREEDAEGMWAAGAGAGAEPGPATPAKTKVKVVGPGRGRMVVKK